MHNPGPRRKACCRLFALPHFQIMLQFSEQERLTLAKLAISVMTDWQVTAGDQVKLLALKGKVRKREMQRYGEDKPLPDDPEVIERAAHLLGIADALRTTFPRNGAMGGVWMHRINRRFQDRTPLRKMLEDGMRGIIDVRIHLDCAYGWRRDAQESGTGE